ncbi:lysophospholipid acyltransferase family protein [Puniceicoccaceae bacterium K14]|nr:lysophospholipid acyltransferase family protein [Puniceicoccaceae bacterium K14]
MIKTQLRYRFIVFILLISRVSGPRVANFVISPMTSVARRNFIRRKYEFMMTNAREALPGREEDEYHSIIKGSVDHIKSFLVRNLCGLGNCLKSTEVFDEAVIDSVITGEDNGAVVITSHQGDWETLIQYFRNREDITACNLYRKPKCPVVDRLLREKRGINQYCSGYGIMKQFKGASTKKVFALIGVDQKPVNKGVEVQFLNRPTVISPVSVQIALKANVPVIIAKTLIKENRAEISFRKVDMPKLDQLSSDEKVRVSLQAVMDEISNDIGEHPEQWVMWSHNFWKQKRAA